HRPQVGVAVEEAGVVPQEAVLDCGRRAGAANVATGLWLWLGRRRRLWALDAKDLLQMLAQIRLPNVVGPSHRSIALALGPARDDVGEWILLGAVMVVVAIEGAVLALLADGAQRQIGRGTRTPCGPGGGDPLQGEIPARIVGGELALGEGDG